MKYLFPISIFVFSFTIAGDIHFENTLSEREVITSDMINSSGLFRIGDILLLSNKIRVSSIDGFSWFSSINGLSSFHRQNWIVLLDGQRLAINTFDIVSINMLPINITKIDSVEIFLVPQIHEGIFTDHGMVHIHTKNISTTKLFTFYQSAGNETGDPGPYIGTKYQSPNVDHIGLGTGLDIYFNVKKMDINMGLNYKEQSLTDWAIRKRNNSIDNDPEYYPSIEMVSPYFKLNIQGNKGTHDIFASYSHSNRYFFFFKPISREIPTDYIIKHIGIINNFIIFNKMNIIHRSYYSNNQLRKYPNTLDFDFDWASNHFHTNLENQFSIFALRGKLGIGFDRYSLNTDYELNEYFYDSYNYYGTVNSSLTENIIQNIDAMVLLSNNKHALKTTYITKWYMNPKHTFNFIISYSQRLLEEDNSLWYWSERGYNLLNRDYTINGNFNKSKTFTIDLIWKNYFSDNWTVEISNYYRILDDIYLEEQHYSFNPEDGSFNSTPIIIHTNQSGKIMGANLALRNNINTRIYQHFYYDYQSEISSEDIIKNAMGVIPKHYLDYQLIFSPVQNFSIYAKFCYLSSSQWNDYNNVSGETYLTLHQDTLKYSNIIKSSNVVDIGIQKWFFKRKIKSNLFLRNVFSQRKRYHPIGASFDLAMYLHITFFPINDY